MNDHQDSENFSYSRSWDEIEQMLYAAEQELNRTWMFAQRCNKDERMEYLRKYKGLEGVINGLRWVLGDLNMTKNKVLGRERNDGKNKQVAR
jgi:hypothetical protein